jgi:hypothetical protein
MKSWDSAAGHESSQASLLVGVSLHLTIFSFLAARISPCILASGNAVGRGSQLVTKPLCPEPIVGGSPVGRDLGHYVAHAQDPDDRSDTISGSHYPT